jgi:hypothetical protein
LKAYCGVGTIISRLAKYIEEGYDVTKEWIKGEVVAYDD